jgi:hypothetical protein
MLRTVSIADHGREGCVTYIEGLHSLSGYQEFGGADVVAIVAMGDAGEWRTHHAWAADRRAEILRFIADELIRQRASACTADIDDERGDIVLRKSATGATATSADAAWVFRYGERKAKFALIVLAIVALVAAFAWILQR